MLSLLTTLLACQPPPASPSLQAVDVSVPLETALAACVANGDGDCALDSILVRGALTARSCERVPVGRARSECFFLAAEASGEIAVGHGLCDRAGEFSRDCHFHLWQAELLALRPGAEERPNPHPEAAAAMARHRPYLSAIDAGYERRFWSWYWGAWWQQQPSRSSEECGALAAPLDAECARWHGEAMGWLDGRR